MQELLDQWKCLFEDEKKRNRFETNFRRIGRTASGEFEMTGVRGEVEKISKDKSTGATGGDSSRDSFSLFEILEETFLGMMYFSYYYHRTEKILRQRTISHARR